MQKFLVNLLAAFVVSTLLSFAAVGQTVSDDLSEELRPFDFSDKYYEENGIYAFTLIDRKNGADGQSVFEATNDPRFTNVRIIATLPAYSADGASLYWNYYGGVTKDSFASGDAVDNAYANPMYVFPSSTIKGTDRQAALIHMSDSYWEKNPLGLAAVYLVEYTDMIHTKGADLRFRRWPSETASRLTAHPSFGPQKR
jgi:hypothetical protein